MLIYIDGPAANPSAGPKEDMDYAAIDKNQIYSDAYPSKDLFGGAVKQLKVRMITLDDNIVLAGANKSAEDETEDDENVVETKLDLLEACNNLEDMTDMYATAKQAEKECKTYFKKVLLPYLNKKDAANIKKFQKLAMEFIQQVFGRKDKENPSKAIPARFGDVRTIRNASFDDETGDYNGTWMFVFDEDQDPNTTTKEAYNAKVKFVWLFPYGQEEIKY